MLVALLRPWCEEVVRIQCALAVAGDYHATRFTTHTLHESRQGSTSAQRLGFTCQLFPCGRHTIAGVVVGAHRLFYNAFHFNANSPMFFPSPNVLTQQKKTDK